jgi:thiol-disulfide isomerase/thioredoxin
MFSNIFRSLLLLAALTQAAPATLPSFSLPDTEGKVHQSSEFSGKPVLIDFWATWCATCKESTPEVAKLHKKYAAKGLQVVSISIDKGSASKVLKGAKKFGIDWQVLHDPTSSLSVPFGFEGIPALYLFDAKGKLVTAINGLDAKQEAALDAALSKL